MRIFVTTVFFYLFAVSAQAETVYISDEYRVPLRKSPCPRCAILHRGIKSGAELTLVETNDEGWSHVTTRGGMDGWMPSHYLQKSPTARDLLANIKSKYEALQNTHKTQEEELTTLKSEFAKLQADLENTQSSKDQVSGELKEIKKISSNAISLNQQNQELLERNGILQSEIDILKAANERLTNSERNTWFLYGAFAVVMGSLLTILIPRLKRRKRFSEWG
jgi:SH3 domain protein